MVKLNAKQLRMSEPTEQELKKIKRRDIYIVCDNILDTYNIGSIFRLADAVSAKCVYLCGDCETPPNIKIHRAAVGTDKWVPWQYAPTAVEAISKMKGQNPNIKVVAIEQSKKSVDFRKISFQEPIGFVIGYETFGVSEETLKACDEVVEIPMYGINISLNVMVSLAMVLGRII